MAAITVVKPLHVSPTAYEVVDKAMATEAMAPGDQVVIGANGISKCPAAAKECHGVVLKPCPINMSCDYGIQGEMDGFSGLTPGNPLYPSATTAGVMDTVVAENTVGNPATVRVRAVTATRIRYNFV